MNLSKAAFFVLLTSLPFSFTLAVNTNQWNKEDLIRNVPEQETIFEPDDSIQAEETSDIDLSNPLPRSSNGDTILNSSKIKGDIAGFKDEVKLEQDYKDTTNYRIYRNAYRFSSRRWRNGEIPYTLSSRYGPLYRENIAEAMQEFHDKTCIKFIARDATKHKDYVSILRDGDCSSPIGRIGGRQTLSLDPSHDIRCMETGTMMHEMMHTVGFLHEHSRHDRDDWIEIDYDNILPGAEDQFEKYSLLIMDDVGLPYDYDSIMHYGPYALSRNGSKTIKAKKSGEFNMGQRKGFSSMDVAKINKLYNCSADSIGTMTTPRPPTTKNPPAECKDRFSPQCTKFRGRGIGYYCSKFRALREKFCRKSCGTCTVGVGESVTNTTRPTTTRPTTSRPTATGAPTTPVPTTRAPTTKAPTTTPRHGPRTTKTVTSKFTAKFTTNIWSCQFFRFLGAIDYCNKNKSVQKKFCRKVYNTCTVESMNKIAVKNLDCKDNSWVWSVGQQQRQRFYS